MKYVVVMDYRLYILRVLLGIVFATAYWYTDALAGVRDPLLSIVISTLYMLLGLVVGGLLSRYMGRPFWRYSIPQIAAYYIATVVLV